MADAANHATTNGGTPAASAFDYFPFLRHLPSMLTPRSSPLAHARASRAAIRTLHDGPWAAAQRDMEAGRNANPSFMRTQLAALQKQEPSNAATTADVKGASAAIIIAGGATTWSTITLFILCMLLHPRVQRKAQRELDALLLAPPDSPAPRLPTFADRPRLPYLDACLNEVYRWAPLSPVGVPHASVAEDSYRGWRIPAGAVVYANAWAMARDPDVYSDPDEFVPERFLGAGEEGGRGEPVPQGQFGFGRRVCPGRHLAGAGVFIVMATMLATVDIVPRVGEDGKEVPVRVRMSNGLSSHPDPFEVDFRPRSRRAEELLGEWAGEGVSEDVGEL